MMSKPDTRRDRPALFLLLAYATMTGLILINDSPEFDSMALVPLYVAITGAVIVFLLLRRRAH